MTMHFTRRDFALSGTALLTAVMTGGVRAQEGVHSVTTSLGTYDIPADPKRVIAIDSRSNLEPAVALGLNLIGYSHSPVRPWVPLDPSVPMLGAPPNIEEILALEPDLIICPTTDPDSEWWPLNKLKAVAPILPTDYLASWQDNLANLAAWLGKPVIGAETIGQYNGLVADIKARHTAAIAGKKVAAVQLDASKNAIHVRTLGTSYGQVMPGQVLAEIGGLAVSADILADSGEVGIESAGDLLGDVEGFLILDFQNGSVEAFADNPLWNRLPAVKAGHTHVLPGNSTFGSLYTALYLAGGWDALYQTLS